jgi:uncharacterized protein YbaP (TraB family)
MSTRISLVFLGFLFHWLPLIAQQPKTLLWEVSGNDLTKSSYVFGTMHLLCDADQMMTDSLLAAIGQSDEVYFEIDMDNPGELLGIFRYIRMKDNKKLADLLSPEEYAQVKEYFAKTRTMLPLSMMETFKPYFVAAMLSESKMACETKNGMEELIMRQAKKQGKEIKGLESIAFQASVFDSIPYEEQAKELVKTIREEAKQDSFANKMLQIYRMQDLDQIEQLTIQEEGGVSGYLDLFLYGRNAKWIPAMEEAMKNQSVLFAVGAAHLPGEKGVLSLLRKAGYTVRPIMQAVSLGRTVSL